jgi:DNA-binding MurR/RpiR family transcriptional regulator
MKNKVTHVPASTTPEIAFARSELGRQLMAVQSEGLPSSRDIASFILRNSVRVTALGITELGASCKVSAATVSRFARTLGFTNYAAMRTAVAETLQTALDPIDKLRSSIERSAHAAAPGIESIGHAMANLDATRQALSLEALEQVVAQIRRARTVYVMGFGLSSHLAAMLVLHLQPFCEQVVEVVAFGGTEVAAGRLMSITERDLLIVICFPRYGGDAVKLTQFAKARKAAVTVITDSSSSPLVKLADHSLMAKSGHPILPSSSTAALALIETIACSLMVANKKNVNKAAELTAAISPYLFGT